MLNLKNVSIYTRRANRSYIPGTKSLQRRINYIGHDVQAFGVTGMTETSLWEWMRTNTRKLKSDYFVSPDPMVVILFYSNRKAAATICRENPLDISSKRRFVITHLVIRYFDDKQRTAGARGHSNLLLFDRKEKCMYVFEPHGSKYAGYKHELINSVVHEQLNEFSNTIGYTYKGTSWNPHRLQKDHFGSCFIWCSLFLWFCVHSKLSPPDIIAEIIRNMKSHKIELRYLLDLFVEYLYKEAKLKGTMAKQYYQNIRTYIVSTYNDPSFRAFIQQIPKSHKMKVNGSDDVYVLQNIKQTYLPAFGYIHWNFDQYTKL